jgi:hypothetical protein
LLENLAAETGFRLEETLEAVLLEIQTEFSRLDFQIHCGSNDGTDLTTKSVYRHSLQVWVLVFGGGCPINFFCWSTSVSQHSHAAGGELPRGDDRDGAWASEHVGRECDEFYCAGDDAS